MIKAHEKYSVRITDTTILGAGVTKIDNFTVFVSGAVTGDECTVEIDEIKKSYAMAHVTELSALSDKRCDPRCELYPECGGCVLRHGDYSFEGEVKLASVKSALAKAGVAPARFGGILMPSEDGYRNKVTFHFDSDGDIGFYSPESRRTVPLNGRVCLTCPEIFCEIASRLSALVKDRGLSVPRELMLRVSSDGEICAALTGELSDVEMRSVVMGVCGFFPEIVSLVARRSVKDRYKAVMGDRNLTTTLAGLKFRISPEAFFQVNYEGAELLFEEALRLAGARPFKKCADLYCGTGTIGLILASRYPEANITGVEINAEAVADAKYNAKLNKVKNVDFFCGDAAGYAASGSPELVVVDPPRKGLSPQMLEVLKQTGAQTVIYVSCNPFTLARDLKWLTENGYAVDEVTAVNMFPRSEHCEVVCALRKTSFTAI